MSLDLIIGPPNSGRTGIVLDRFVAALEREPLLIVPTRDDADRFERELGRREGTVLGGTVLTFERLFAQVGEATGQSPAPLLTEAQRLRVAREAIGETDLAALDRSAEGSGFAIVLLEAFDAVQAACIDPATLATRAAELDDGAYERELAALYGAYCAVRNHLGRSDSHSRAAAVTAALRSAPDSWGGRPVLIYGFDDMSGEQVELLEALAAATEVTIALPWEDRLATAARAGLLARLVEIGGRVVDRRQADPANTESPALHHLERHFLEPGPPAAKDTDGLVVLEAAGERSQAELIGSVVARLLADGEEADSIAVVLRNPSAQGELYGRLFEQWGIPVAVEAQIPLRATAAGRGLLAALRVASGRGDVDELLAFLRSAPGAKPDDVDWLERFARRARLQETGPVLEEWVRRVPSALATRQLSKLRDAGPGAPLLAAVAELARSLAQRPLRRRAVLADRARRLELRAAESAARAAEELAELELTTAGSSLLETLDALRVPLWSGSTEGRVRILSPYRVRARRVRHLFIASLQGGEFPRREAPASLLAPQVRSRLGLPPRAEPEAEESYLFYVCLSRPVKSLYLSHCETGEDGEAREPSPLLERVGELLNGGLPPPRRRAVGDLVFPPTEAPTARELARALASPRPPAEAAKTLVAMAVPDSVADEVNAALGHARRGLRLPGPLASPGVLSELGKRRLFGASTLEEYELCSYRWFVQHELSPRPLGPDPDSLVSGSVAHTVLEELYRDPPAAEPLPRPETLDEWLGRARRLLERAAAERGLEPRDAASRAALSRIGALVARFLREEAARETPFVPERDLLEARFGEDEEDAKPPLELNGYSIHGKIDRVDVDRSGPVPLGLVSDYKTGTKATTAKKLEEEGKLQLPLYMLALRRLWTIEPIGGLYRPLGSKDSPVRPRGLLHESQSEHLEPVNPVREDFLAEQDFEAALTRAEERSAQIVAEMRSGQITRDPLKGKCPYWCEFQTICRRERSLTLEREQLPGDEEEEEPA
jgi:ATP-dependent helicase/nuclease subunit B